MSNTETWHLELEPVDAWYFGDAGPYDMGEASQTESKTLFPPHAPTLVGALRAMLARAKGWDGRSRWNEGTNVDLRLEEVLGKDYWDLGQVRFEGPFLTRVQSNSDANEVMVPMPLHILGRMKELDTKEKTEVWEPAARLRPGNNAVLCDMGRVRLPKIASDKPERGLKEPEGIFVTVAGLEAILRGDLPATSEVVRSRDLWRGERRVGLERERESRTAKEGALYSPTYVRLKPGVRLTMGVSGLPEDWVSEKFTLPGLMPLGGEGRMASVERLEGAAMANAPLEAIAENGRMSVTLLTSALLTPDDTTVTWPRPHSALAENIPGTIVSACVGKPHYIGGWDSLKRKPVAPQPFVPAGSTYFLEDVDADLETLRQLHGSCIGRRQAFGFGQVALGVW
ncbi:hypothetical protein FRC98_19690 [Lujinxingia vulgaris]|uniref:Type III-B CRISPR module-associated protein Cmr3 n=1 Tax=Lujinxingia vulgaris TaxID=2600176 RepID=A0A5C6WZ89_9DELT|nr:type III-B CRISPR module-associated protein Cmr3 [Lujinxingia vulgaris]TXD34081.1 hypothetical protein FRC98_19690 [Lujinxingia vulgaris]